MRVLLVSLVYLATWNGPFRAMSRIYHEHGVRGLFLGHSATVLRILPYAAIKFMAYEQIKILLMTEPKHETAIKKFVAGSLAGCVSVFFTYPLDLLRVRLAFEGKPLLETTRIIYHEPNRLWQNPGALTPLARLCNFYRGFLPTLYGMIPYAGVSFLTYESLKSYASQQTWCTNGDKLKPWAVLACGALSGMLAQTCSYPLEIIRRQMQIASKVDIHNRHVTTWQTAKSILTTKGFKGLWIGLTIGYLKVIPMFAVSFFSYEYLKTLMHID